MLSAWLGGLRAGLLATLLAGMLGIHFFNSPIGKIISNENGEGVRLILFIVEGTLISVLSYRLQKKYTVQEQNDFFSDLVNSIRDYAIFALNPQGYITSWNSGAVRIKGYQANEIVGKHFARFYPDTSSTSDYLHQASQTGTFNDEQLLVRKDGSHFWANVVITPIRDFRGKVRGYVNIICDITERKQREDNLQKQIDDLERSNRLKLLFLGMISHELRTPLTSIKGFISTLLAKDVHFSEVEQRQFLTIADQETDKLTELVEQLLNVSRLQSGSLTIVPDMHPPDEIIQIALAQLNTLTTQHNLHIQGFDRMPAVYVDPVRIAQVLVNLVNNAVKFAPKQTHITVSAHSKNGIVQIDVSDEGKGIPLEAQEYIFDVFRQVEHQKHQSNKGVGLGLAICKGIIQAHGGKIWVQNRKGIGTTISFTLPIVT